SPTSHASSAIATRLRSEIASSGMSEAKEEGRPRSAAPIAYLACISLFLGARSEKRLASFLHLYIVRPASALRRPIFRLGQRRAGVTNFSFHKHLPHYAVTTEDTSAIKVLGTQPIDMSKPHPFTEAGNREFNSFVWMPPANARGAEILLADSTVFSTLFGA